MKALMSVGAFCHKNPFKNQLGEGFLINTA